MSKDWQVGEKHGDFEFVEEKDGEATFRYPDGSLHTFPNIFQAKSPAELASRERKPRTPTIRANASEDSLEKALEAAKARLAAAKAKRQTVVA